MYDAAFPSEPHQSQEGHQRARGALHISFKRRGAATVLDNLRQDGCLKARFPNREPNAWTCSVMLNSSGGIAAGDLLSVAIEAGPGCAATMASQAAERVYRALPGAAPARLRTRLSVADGAALEWLPQETILFNQAALDRTLDVELTGTARFTGVETLIFGRTAMGESIESARVTDRVRIHRDGRLILHDAIRAEGPVHTAMRSQCSAGGRAAVATILHAGDADSVLDPMRAALLDFASGTSLVSGLLVTRIVAADMADARRAVLAGLAVLRGGRPMPRVWQS